MQHIAVYGGTFDILTLGHVWMIKQGARLFDRLVVAVGDNPSKRNMFDPIERKEMIEHVATELDLPVLVDEFHDRYLVDYALSRGSRFLLRGIRNSADYENERTLRVVNSEIRRGVTSVFLMPPPKLAAVASSMVKALIGPTGWEKEVARYVPPSVLERIKEKHHAS